MMLLKLAWRNVFRHRRRTWITAAAISIGLGAMIMSNTMMNGMDTMASFNIINYETGHLEIFASGYYREEGMFPLDTIIDDPDALYRRIKDIRGIKGMTERVKFPARVSNGIDEFPVLGIGVDMRTESEVFETQQAIVSGTMINDPGQILVGTELTKLMGADTGTILTIITRDKHGTFNAYDFMVTGLINTTHPLFDGNAVIMDLDAAQELLALDKGVTEISLKLNKTGMVPEMKAKIQDTLGDEYEVYTFKELYASIFEVSGFKRLMQFMVALVVIVIAAVGIVNTMLMAVMERIPEIGTLKAMGFGNWEIIKMFLYEGGIIGVFGSALGCVYGLLVSLIMVFVGIDFSSMFDTAEMNYPIKFLLKGEIDPVMVCAVFLFGVVVSIIVTLWPVRRATRLRPVDALRHI
ncbi:ABC transporter permease [candidate division WOR-3 bacterium]|nr:ABC transporter permease [candidate division WOR-3 bacterium]